jgi:hypothetical protein
MAIQPMDRIAARAGVSDLQAEHLFYKQAGLAEAYNAGLAHAKSVFGATNKGWLSVEDVSASRLLTTLVQHQLEAMGSEVATKLGNRVPRSKIASALNWGPMTWGECLRDAGNWVVYGQVDHDCVEAAVADGLRA